MWFKFSRLSFKTNLLPEEIVSRLKGVTEEPEDIIHIVPLKVYKFKGSVKLDKSELKMHRGSYIKELDVLLHIEREHETKVTVFYRVPILQTILSVIIFCVIFLFLLFAFVIEKSYSAFLSVVLFFWGFIGLSLALYSGFADRKVNKTMEYVLGDKYNYENVKYRHW